MSIAPFRFRPCAPLVVWGTSLLLLQAVALWLWSPNAHAQDTPQQRADALVAQMTTDEKLDLVASGTNGVPRLGIPPLAYRDGPNGVGEGEQGVTALPNAVTLGAAWDPQLARRYGVALGEEVRAKGFTGLLGPTIEPLRNPLWGRAAETYGEDPFLNSRWPCKRCAASRAPRCWRRSSTSRSTPRSTGGSASRLTRPGTNSEVSLRTLEEIYFAPFKAAVQQAQAASVMCSYVRINGTPSCQNPQTLGILKGWGLLGFVAPDAVFAIRDVARGGQRRRRQLPARAASPPGTERSSSRPRWRAATFRRPGSTTRRGGSCWRWPRSVCSMRRRRQSSRSRAPALTASLRPRSRLEATVLLKNEQAGKGGRVLPLGRSDRSIAVIGYDAGAATQIEEGGSPAVLPGAPGISRWMGSATARRSRTKVSYAQGHARRRPAAGRARGRAHSRVGVGSGAVGDVLSRAPRHAARDRRSPRVSIRRSTSHSKHRRASLLQPIPGTSASSARWTGTLTPPETAGTGSR